MRRALTLGVLLLGATTAALGTPEPPRAQELEPTGLAKSVALVGGDGYALADVRIQAAPRDLLAGPGSTAIARDHWVLEAALLQTGPHAAPARVRLEWDGAPRGTVMLAPPGEGALAELAFDLGPRLERSAAYRLVLATP